MDQIKKLDQIFHIARSEISLNVRKNYADKNSSDSNVSRKNHSTRDTKNLRNKISKKLTEIDSSDFRYQSNARRAFLEITLEWEFGEYFNRSDINFYHIINEIQRAIENDSETLNKFDELIQELKN